MDKKSFCSEQLEVITNNWLFQLIVISEVVEGADFLSPTIKKRITTSLGHPLFYFNYLNILKRSASFMYSFSPAGVSIEPNGICALNFQEAGISHSLATASSINGL